MIERDFVLRNITLINELVNKIIMEPTEQSYKECIGAVALRLSMQNPTLPAEQVVAMAASIVENVVLNQAQLKQQSLLNKYAPNKIQEINKNQEGYITLVQAFGIGIVVVILLVFFSSTGLFSDDTSAVIMTITILVLFFIPKKEKRRF